MTAILLCGEGPHDVGQKDWNARTGEETYHEGWMQPLIRKSLTTEVSFGTKQLRELVRFPRPRAIKPTLKGQADKAAIAKYIAGIEGYDTVIYMTDADTRVEAERTTKIGEIREGFAVHTNNAIGVPCVPKSTSECWLLSDRDAWQSMGLATNKNFPAASPEDLWGERSNPKANHPKHAFSRVATDAGVEDNRETRRQVCELSSLQVMMQRCPISLVDFVIELRAAIK